MNLLNFDAHKLLKNATQGYVQVLYSNLVIRVNIIFAQYARCFQRRIGFIERH